MIAIVVSFLVKTFLVQPFYVPSDSMGDTLVPGDRILVSLLTTHLAPLKRGDVIVFRDPGGWLGTATSTGAPDILTFLGLAASADDSHLVKRVIGLPGDTVACCSATGQLTINGTPIAEPYLLLPAGRSSADEYTYSVTVPKGDLWVLGDNRYNSADSAYRNDKRLGSPFVPVKDVVGRALVVNWPIAHWGYLDDYPSTFANVGKPHPTVVPKG